jgi:hypothetical protein
MLSTLLTYLPEFSVVADWASVISLFVSGYAAYGITKVRSQIVDRIRLPTLLEALERHGNSLAKLMRTYADAETKDNILLELAVCETNLRQIRTKTVRARTSARALLREIAKYKGPIWLGYRPAITTRDQAWKIYSGLNAIIEEIKNVVEEQRMGA